MNSELLISEIKITSNEKGLSRRNNKVASIFGLYFRTLRYYILNYETGAYSLVRYFNSISSLIRLIWDGHLYARKSTNKL